MTYSPNIITSLLLNGDNKIILLFALYGLLTGVLTYISSLSVESEQLLVGIGTAMNFPAIMTLFWFEWFIFNPNGYSVLNGDIGCVTIIVGSMLIWSAVGLLIVGLMRLFRLGP